MVLPGKFELRVQLAFLSQTVANAGVTNLAATPGISFDASLGANTRALQSALSWDVDACASNTCDTVNGKCVDASPPSNVPFALV